MIYSGQFKDINGRVLTVRFTSTEEGLGETAITLGATPFVTTVNNSGKLLYTPALYEAATVELVTATYLSGLYTGKAQGVKAELLAEDSVIWTGYVEPTIYSQPYAHALEVLSVDCVNALATLQHFKFESEEGKITVPFSHLIAKLLRRCNAYKRFYVSANVEIPEAAASPMESAVISMENFYKKRSDPNEVDNDLAWTCRDVLEEVCRFWGLTCVASGQDVYFLDYDALKASDRRAWCYRVDDGECEGIKDTPGVLRAITGDVHSDTDTVLGMEPVYNKATVTDDFYTMDDVTIDPFDPSKVINITPASDPLGVSVNGNASFDDHPGALLDTTSLRFSDDDEAPGLVQRLFDAVYAVKADEWKNPNLVVVRWLSNPAAGCRAYSYQGGKATEIDYPQAIGYTGAKTFCGALLAQFSVQQLPWPFKKGAVIDITTEEFVNTLLLQTIVQGAYRWGYNGAWAGGRKYLTTDNFFLEEEITGNAERIKEVHKYAACRQGISSIKPTNTICLFNPVVNHLNPDSEEFDRLPFFSTSATEVRSGLVGGKDSYLVISGNFRWHYDQDSGDVNPYPIPSGQADPIGRKKKLDRNYMYIPESECWTYAFLRHNGRSWDGSAWVDDPDGSVVFKLWYFEPGDDNDKRSVPNCICEDMPIRNNIDYTMGLGSRKGTAIPLPGDGLLSSVPVFGLCKPHDPKMWYRDDEGPHYYTFDRVFLTDLKLEIAGGNELLADPDAEVAFTNVIDLANAVELDEIKFKITTADSSHAAYSNVGVRCADGVLRYLTKTINVALHQSEGAAVDGAVEGLRQEEHLLFKIVEQYRRPGLSLTMTIHDTGLGMDDTFTSDSAKRGALFVVRSMERDYRFATAKITIAEKF